MFDEIKDNQIQKEPEDIFARTESAIPQPKKEGRGDNFNFEFEEKKPSKIKKLIVIIIGLLLVAGLAYGGYFGYIKYQQSAALKKEAQKTGNLINSQQQEESKTGNTIINKDADADGLSDQDEIRLGTNINKVDTDNDGLSDREEVNVYKTNPLKADTDGDGFSDGQEVKSNYNPNNPIEGAKLMDLQKEIEKLKQ